jgi:hypothetical protein
VCLKIFHGNDTVPFCNIPFCDLPICNSVPFCYRYHFVTCTVLVHVSFYYMYRFVTASFGNVRAVPRIVLKRRIACNAVPFYNRFTVV